MLLTQCAQCRLLGGQGGGAAGLVLCMLGRHFWKGEASRIAMISTAGRGMSEIKAAAIRRSRPNMEISREVDTEISGRGLARVEAEA